MNKIGFWLLLISVHGLGWLFACLFLHYDLLSNNFFEFRLIELLRLIVMLFLGLFVAYWVSIKTNLLQKRKDLCLRLIDEGISLLITQKNLTFNLVDAEDKKEGNIVLSGFRRLTNKVTTLDAICKKIDKNISTKKLYDEWLKVKSQFGEHFYSGFDKKTKQELIRDFDKYEKLLDDFRVQIID